MLSKSLLSPVFIKGGLVDFHDAFLLEEWFDFCGAHLFRGVFELDAVELKLLVNRLEGVFAGHVLEVEPVLVCLIEFLASECELGHMRRSSFFVVVVALVFMVTAIFEPIGFVIQVYRSERSSGTDSHCGGCPLIKLSSPVIIAFDV